MANLRKTCCASLIILVLTVFLVGFGEAATLSLTIKSAEEVTQPISLVVEDRVLIQVRVIGTTSGSGYIQFSMTCPNGTVQNFGEVSSFTTGFVCDFEGEYTLNFTNADQSENKLVTLNYNIDHYIFGIPQTLFLVLLIGVVSVLGVAVFIGLSRKPY
jgi:hypothetical protein